MLLRRIIEHVKAQNWTAVTLDFVIVVFGVYCGVFISEYQNQRGTLKKQGVVVEALRQDMLLIGTLDVQFRREVDTGLSNWQAAYADGAMPAPYFFRIPGSDTPPQHIWNSLQQSQLTELFSPDLLNDLGLYYSELQGVSEKYRRYVIFVENEVLPGLKEDQAYFYRESGGRLKSIFEANMDRLRDWRDENNRLSAWSGCLAVRLEKPRQPSENCTPDLSSSVVDSVAVLPVTENTLNQ